MVSIVCAVVVECCRGRGHHASVGDVGENGVFCFRAHPVPWEQHGSGRSCQSWVDGVAWSFEDVGCGCPTNCSSQRLRNQGFAATRRGHHIPARAQERILSQACEVDARVALLEVVFVTIVLHLGCESGIPAVTREPQKFGGSTRVFPQQFFWRVGHSWIRSIFKIGSLGVAQC